MNGTTYYIGILDTDGAILAVAGPWERAWEASEARAEFTAPGESRFGLPLIVHRAPRPVRRISLAELRERQGKLETGR